MKFTAFPRNCDAYLFDLDELLLESLPRHRECWRRMMEHARLDLPLTPELFSSLAHAPASAIAEQIARTHDTWIDLEHFLYEKEALYSDLRADAQLALFLRAMISQLSAEYSVGIVTGGSRAEALQSLDLAGLGTSARLVAAGDGLLPGKPAPDLYLLAAGILRTPPVRCVVVLDGSIAETAASSAQMIPFRLPVCIAVTA